MAFIALYICYIVIEVFFLSGGEDWRVSKTGGDINCFGGQFYS
jgi:hypothetical protein